jgi:hypothetical protein
MVQVNANRENLLTKRNWKSGLKLATQNRVDCSRWPLT